MIQKYSNRDYAKLKTETEEAGKTIGELQDKIRQPNVNATGVHKRGEKTQKSTGK